MFVGVDPAKNLFAVHAVNEAGKAELVRPNVTRGMLQELIANLPPRTIGMKARNGAHPRARLLHGDAHAVRRKAGGDERRQTM